MTGNYFGQVRTYIRMAKPILAVLLQPVLKIRASKMTLTCSDDSQIEQLTSTGPFSGRLGAFTTGVRLRTRYHRLLSVAGSQGPTIKYWASDSPRVIETARYFGAGFFGLDWQDRTTLEVIPEDASRGADTLTPGDTCLTYYHDPIEGHDYGYTALNQFRATYLGAIRDRLLEQNPGIHFCRRRGLQHAGDVWLRDNSPRKQSLVRSIHSRRVPQFRICERLAALLSCWPGD
jgi:hypothetical protein